MRLASELSVKAPLERTWPALLELGGAVDADLGRGYAGSARLDDVDEDEHAAGFHLVARERDGSGLASATVRARASADGEATRVAVETELLMTGGAGRPDQDAAQAAVDKLLARAASQLELTAGAPRAEVDRSVADLARELLATEEKQRRGVAERAAVGGRVTERALFVAVGVAIGLVLANLLWRRH